MSAIETFQNPASSKGRP